MGGVGVIQFIQWGGTTGSNGKRDDPMIQWSCVATIHLCMYRAMYNLQTHASGGEESNCKGERKHFSLLKTWVFGENAFAIFCCHFPALASVVLGVCLCVYVCKSVACAILLNIFGMKFEIASSMLKEENNNTTKHGYLSYPSRCVESGSHTQGRENKTITKGGSKKTWCKRLPSTKESLPSAGLIECTTQHPAYSKTVPQHRPYYSVMLSIT